MKKSLIAPLLAAALFLIPAGAFANSIAQQTTDHSHVSLKAGTVDTGNLVAANGQLLTIHSQSAYCQSHGNDEPIPGSDAP